MTFARANPPGTVEDHRIKRLYLGRLALAQARYDEAMRRPRLLLKAARSRALKVAKSKGDEAAVAIVTKAFKRFERAQERCDRARTRRRRRAEQWLARQDEPLAFRQVHRPARQPETFANGVGL